MSKKAPRKFKVLFVCHGNTCRSQMAEALARHTAADMIEATSAGLMPFGEIVRPTRLVLEERGVSLDGQYCKPLRREDCQVADLIVNMTGRPAAALRAGDTAKIEDWDVGDPYGGDPEIYRQICDEIARRVTDLARRLRRQQAG